MVAAEDAATDSGVVEDERTGREKDCEMCRGVGQKGKR